MGTFDKLLTTLHERNLHWSGTKDDCFTSERIKQTGTVLVLHLLLEHKLNAIIQHHFKGPCGDLLEGNNALGFQKKILLLKALINPFGFPPIELWDYVESLNNIRNCYSHGLQLKRIKDKVNELRDRAKKLAVAYEAHGPMPKLNAKGQDGFVEQAFLVALELVERVDIGIIAGRELRKMSEDDQEEWVCNGQ